MFVVVDGVVRTPPLDSGCLAGITRELVLEWCAADGVEVVEEALPLDVLTRADEVFLTSSIKDVFPVSALDGRALPAPGPVTARVQSVWAAHVGLGVDP